MTGGSIFTHRLTIVTGHYGTGKTEFAVNLALDLARESAAEDAVPGVVPKSESAAEKTAPVATTAGARVMLADLDIVNPYFRSRERKAMLEAAGVQVICSSQACSDADVPALPAEVLTILENPEVCGVLDIGGDPVGARVLARYQPKIVTQDYQMVYVLNANRPEVREPEAALRVLREIERVTGLICSGIVNNTHLCGETTEAEIRKGAALAKEVSRLSGLPATGPGFTAGEPATGPGFVPVIGHVAEQGFVPVLGDLEEPVFPITIRMKKPWE